MEIEPRRLDVGDPGDSDALVNNAGVEVHGAIEMIDHELVRRQLDTNVLGPLRPIRAVLTPRWPQSGKMRSCSASTRTVRT